MNACGVSKKYRRRWENDCVRDMEMIGGQPKLLLLGHLFCGPLPNVVASGMSRLGCGRALVAPSKVFLPLSQDT